jgi:hypothetical protein
MHRCFQLKNKMLCFSKKTILPDGVPGLPDKHDLATANLTNHPSQHELGCITWQAANCEKREERADVVSCRPLIA